jgi:hypothetical protein
MSIKYEYVGRLDISSGNVTMGLNYTSVIKSYLLKFRLLIQLE